MREKGRDMSEDIMRSNGMRLIQKGKRGFFHGLIFSRTGLITLLLLLQIFFVLGFLFWYPNSPAHFLAVDLTISVIVVLHLINSPMDSSAKATWLVTIMIATIPGSLLYVFTQSDTGHRTLKKRVEDIICNSSDLLPQNNMALETLKAKDKGAASLARFVNNNRCHPLYRNTGVDFFPDGEAMWHEMLRQLERAQDYIFMEYFIIGEGLMWGKVLEILTRKAKEGVEVRVMYDGTCAFSSLPYSYPDLLRKLGINCKQFAPVTPIVSTHYNYRDHRKILVVDGQVAFNGGINLADEYINVESRFGKWKDTAVMLRGSAVRSFTLMFLQMWNIDEQKTESFDRYLTYPDCVETKGYVMPYGDCPLDSDKMGERVYISILNRATEYVHIMTPYLILDDVMSTALKFAAERGVDVKVITPGTPDKRSAYSLAKNTYAELLQAGVQIFEYTPGFVHAKSFVADDVEAVVGTINLDYRSLYHHFECATWMYETPCIEEIEEDFQETLKECRKITMDNIWDGHKALMPVGKVLKILAPLL